MVSSLAGQCSLLVKKLAGATVTKGTARKRSHTTRAHDEATENRQDTTIHSPDGYGEIM